MENEVCHGEYPCRKHILDEKVIKLLISHCTVPIANLLTPTLPCKFIHSFARIKLKFVGVSIHVEKTDDRRAERACW